MRRSPRASSFWVDDVEIGAELREGGHFPVLRQLALERADGGLHRLDLRRRTDPRHRDADVHRRADALVEQVGLEEDLAVGDRDHIGRDVGRDVVGLGLDQRQGGQRARTEILVQLGRALEQAGVEIEDVARIGFASRRAAQQQAHLAIGHGLFRQVVVDDEGVHAVVAEPLAHGAARERREELQRRRVRRGGRDNDGVVEGAALFEAS